MMNVPIFEAPSDYEIRVKNPGEAFLADCPKPSNAQFRKHAYWTRMHDQIYHKYNGICSYSQTWVPRSNDPDATAIGFSTIDHFIPKGHCPSMAYQWDNFRLARNDINENKDNSLDVVDPFFIENNWVALDFRTCIIKVSDEAQGIVRMRLNKTFNILKLNEFPIIEERSSVIGNYAHDLIDLETLHQFYPFIAREIIRQNIPSTLKEDLKSVYPREGDEEI